MAADKATAFPTSTEENTPSSLSQSSSSSFVYPIRSLFSGRIQSAGENARDQVTPNKPSSSSSDTPDPAETPSIAGQDSGTESLDKEPSSEAGSIGSSDTSLVSQSSNSQSERLTKSHSRKGHSSKRSKDGRSPTMNFSHFPAGKMSDSSRSFATHFPTQGQQPPVPSSEPTYAAGPTGEPVLISVPTPYNERNDFDYKHLTHVSGFGGETFAGISGGALGGLPQIPESLPFNPSEYGLVHLPPLPPRGASMTGGSSSGNGSSKYSTAPSSHGSRHSGQDLATAVRDIMSSNSSRSATDSRKTTGSGSGSNIYSSIGRSSSSWGSNVGSINSEPIATMRYRHTEDENGNHLVTGREGQLTRCEDEPIRTPGAVQGFGVLIAVEENLENGDLLVRQVSENSTQLLGLSSKYLFSLECFTETLPDAQADILHHNIQYLSDADSEQEDSPQVFTITGYGGPGSAIPGEPDHDGRRKWTCWCAAHRPKPISSQPSAPSSERSTSASDNETHSPIQPLQTTIILEFELERDTHNPLYPISNEGRSGRTSPTSTSRGSAGSAGSGGFNNRTRSSTDDSDKTTMGLDDQATPPAQLTPSNSSIGPVQTTDTLSSEMVVADTDEDGIDWVPSAEEVLESTTSRSKPIPALERLRRMSKGVPSGPGGSAPVSGGSTGVRARREAAKRVAAAAASNAHSGAGGVGMMDVFAVMSQINEQLGAAPDLDSFLKIVAGIVKDLSQFHRVLVYQFDEVWNGQVVAELVDWSHSHDLFQGLHFPASDIPAQARELYAINKVRLLYDRSQTTARIIVRSKSDLDNPINMTHCYLRAMSPIHIKYLANMGVRASMSISIMAFGVLWGLIACHSYGNHCMRVSFPVRQMLRLLSQSICRNIERLSYAQRLQTRRLINTMASDEHPTGHIVSNADDLLTLFDADYGILVIGEGAKILGPNTHGQEILVVAEYLRLKQFESIKISQAVVKDFPDLELSTGLEVIAGLLYVPLSSGGKDFIAFLRKGQPKDVHWAGKPRMKDGGKQTVLEPRKSFKIWSETVAGRCRVWTDEQMETAGVLSLVYGKFIEVWRQKETALQTTKLTNILLSNATHEVRTPLNHIINYLEMALDGPLDVETRDNLSASHAASKSLLFTINDLLDLTRLESGNETSLNEAFDLQDAIDDATRVYRNEASRRELQFHLDLSESPRMVIGDSKKIKTVVANLTANALKYTLEGSITVHCRTFGEPEGLRAPKQTAVEIVVADTGCGIPSDELESIFREFEQVESSEPNGGQATGLGLGLAVVARIVEQLGGQLRVDSKVNQGSQFSFLIPLMLPERGRQSLGSSGQQSSAGSIVMRTRNNSRSSAGSEIDSLVEALSSNHMSSASGTNSPSNLNTHHIQGNISKPLSAHSVPGVVDMQDSNIPLRPLKVDSFTLDDMSNRNRVSLSPSEPGKLSFGHEKPLSIASSKGSTLESDQERVKLRVLIVEDNDVNRRILGKRLALGGHTVVNTVNGQECVDMIQRDQDFDCVLMDIQMPILNGFEATVRVRQIEDSLSSKASLSRRASQELNGRIPVFAVSASLFEHQREEMMGYGMDGWILKPIDFKRLDLILKGVTDRSKRQNDVYFLGRSWELGGWFSGPPKTHPSFL